MRRRQPSQKRNRFVFFRTIIQFFLISNCHPKNKSLKNNSRIIHALFSIPRFYEVLENVSHQLVDRLKTANYLYRQPQMVCFYKELGLFDERLAPVLALNIGSEDMMREKSYKPFVWKSGRAIDCLELKRRAR